MAPILRSQALSSGMFAGLLYHDDASRAAEVVETLLTKGLRCALTGSLAIDAQLHAHGHAVAPRHLNDIDLVVDRFTSIPASLAASFLQHHVHPDATDGRTLLQLVDEARKIRIDLFRDIGSTLSRARPLNDLTGLIDVLSVEDLVARTTALVCGRVRRGLTIDVKHATAFSRLRALGQPVNLAAAWNDHRQHVPGTFEEASREAARLLEAHPELVVVEEYSSDVVPCERCRGYGPFRPAPLERVVAILGYC
jgi:hypothetical protein